MAGRTSNAFHFDVFRSSLDLVNNAICMLWEDGDGWDMASQAFCSLFKSGMSLEPQTKHSPEDRRLQGCAMKQSPIHPSKRMKILTTFPHAFPFFKMPFLALLALC